MQNYNLFKSVLWTVKFGEKRGSFVHLIEKFIPKSNWNIPYWIQLKKILSKSKWNINVSLKEIEQLFASLT